MHRSSYRSFAVRLVLLAFLVFAAVAAFMPLVALATHGDPGGF